MTTPPLDWLNPHDEDELRVTVYIEEDKVCVAFGKDVNWIGLDVDKALALVHNLLIRVEQLKIRGKAG
jgi:hypothetical protein